MSGFTLDTMPSILGKGRPGGQPPGGLLGGGAGPTGGTGMDGSSTRGRDRTILRKAFGNFNLIPGHNPAPVCEISPGCRGLAGNTKDGAPITPFRAASNAGDMAGTINEAPAPRLPGVNQINTIGPAQIHAQYGGIHNDGGALYSGNPRYVYDSSDYIRFRKLQAKNRNYNDSSFGGSNNGSYTFLMAVR